MIGRVYLHLENEDLSFGCGKMDGVSIKPGTRESLVPSGACELTKGLRRVHNRGGPC